MNIKVIDLADCISVNAQGFQRISIFNSINTDCNEISLEYVVLPKGEESSPHSHIDTHTVIYTLKGSVRLYFGDKLENQTVVKPQGCVYIPPNIIHYVVNENEEEMIAVVARTPSLHKIEDYTNLTSCVKNNIS